jgi:ABC-type transporter Mla maintaining outer membrane lipid asymmetry ATPase subunit MlaF
MVDKKVILKITNLLGQTPIGPVGSHGPISLTVHESEAGVLLDTEEGRRLFRLILGQGTIEQGSIQLIDKFLRNADKDYENSQDVIKQIGFGFRDLGLISNRTIFENVDLPARYHEYYKKGDTSGSLAVKALRDLGVNEAHWSKRPPHVNFNIRKRVLLARAAVLDPKIFLLDEPTAQLESEMGPEILKWISAKKERGSSFLISCSDYPFSLATANWLVDPKNNTVSKNGTGIVDEAWQQSAVLLQRLSERPGHT